ncbi:MAG: DUF4011 domain-containing protein [Candidatus Ratteibacteria bacterium]
MSNKTEERIKRWKNKLIDLSKRNRLLNFKPTKVTTIYIVDKTPSDIYESIVADEKQMSFLPITEENTIEPAPIKIILESNHENSKFNFQKSSALSDTEEFTGEYKGLFLQTDLSKQKLDKNLFRIASISKSVMEEQGYNALFLSLGMLEWYESNESEIQFNAPIILIPVELIRKSIKNKYVIKYASEESPIINPALIYKLSLEFGIDLENLVENLESFNCQEVFKKIEEAISNYSRWKVVNKIFLGLFSFNKFIMYKDIERNMQILTNNTVIRSICGDMDLESRLGLNDICPEEEIRDGIKPSETFQVLDADSSQQRAIIAVKKGHNLIVEGPPGTGKSQTIANIIGESLIAGKKILFVSQKMAAL